jgi:hypothetical protein
MRDCNVWSARIMRVPAKCLLGVMCAGIAMCSAESLAIDGVVINERVFNDDPASVLVTTSSYPTLVQFSDTPTGVGGANLHNFHLADGVSEHSFGNNEPFVFSTDLTISGIGQGEAGVQIAPWWSPNVDGRLNFRTNDGEIAAFGGRLPFYSFTASQGLTYTKGTTVRVSVTYDPNSLTMADPATIKYDLTIGLNSYTSGALAFDEGNAAEGFGTWGHLDDARVGGYMQISTSASGAGGNLTATFGNMTLGVPEPTTLAMVGLAAVGLVGIRRRSK